MGLEEVRRQSLITFGTSLLLTAAGFLATIYFAHAAGPAVLGGYFLFLAYFGIFNLIGDGGIGSAAVKRISEGEEQNEYFSALLILRGAFLAVSVLTLLLLRPVMKDFTAAGLFPWLMLAICVSFFSGTGSAGTYGQGRIGAMQAAGLLNTITKLIIQVAAIFLGYGTAGLAGGFVAGMAAGAILNLHLLTLRPVRFGMHHIRSLFRFSLWSLAAGGGAFILSFADTVLIGYFMANTEVGIYQTAQNLTTVATFTALALRTVLYPKLSRWHHEDNTWMIERNLARAFTYSFMLAVPVCVGGWLLSERLLYFLYGAPFVPGTPALIILLGMQIPFVLTCLMNTALSALDHPEAAGRATLLAASVNIVLNLMLIPTFGLSGAAIATLTATLVLAVLGYRRLSGLIDLKAEPGPLLHIIVSASIMGVAVGAWSSLIGIRSVWSLIGAVALGALVYVILLLKTDGGIHDDLKGVVTQIGLPWPGWL